MDLLLLADGDLADDVRGAEAVQAQPARRGFAREAPGAKADQAGAQQRRRMAVVIAPGQGEAEALVGGGVFGKAAVAVIAGEHRKIAEVFALHGAKRTAAAGAAQPGNADPLADGKAAGLRAPGDDLPDHLMAGHHAGAVRRQVAVDDVQVSAAHTAGQHAHHHVVVPGLRRRFETAQQPVAG